MKKPISYNYCFNDEKSSWYGLEIHLDPYIFQPAIHSNTIIISKSAIHEVTIYNISFWITNDYRLVTNIRIYTYYYM